MSDKVDLSFGSNEVRLSPREWLVALALILALLGLAPILWPLIEPLRLEPDHRLPFSLGNDYYSYARLCRAANVQGKTLVVGDSVVWGHYVSKDETLSACLNRLAGSERFANLGVDGIHPAAMLGLVTYHATAIRNREVILHCNLLWMSDARADLQDTKERPINHPTLIPQFWPSIPCYREPFADRLGIAIERRLPFHAWKKHIQIAYFQSTDFPSWTLERPYDCPVGAVTLELPSPNEEPSPKPNVLPWTEKEDTKRGSNAKWVELDTSLQWRFFRGTVELLRSRGNRVFVILGPFNEHMLKGESRAAYAARKQVVEAWLEANGVPHFVAPLLPSALYADASHPLAEGYKLLAKQLFENDVFANFHGRPR